MKKYIIKLSALLFLLHVLFSCKETNTLYKPGCNNLEQGDAGFVRLVKQNNPGETLVIYGKVLDEETNIPIKNASLFLYHADTAGHYNSWLFGFPPYVKIRESSIKTITGCFKVQTILPGDYPGAKDNKHIHFVLKARNLYEGLIHRA